MKKRFLSLLMVLCLMLTLAPAAFAMNASGLQALINRAEVESGLAVNAGGGSN